MAANQTGKRLQLRDRIGPASLLSQRSSRYRDQLGSREPQGDIKERILCRRLRRTEQDNVLEAFDTLFNKRDYEAGTLLVAQHIQTARTLTWA